MNQTISLIANGEIYFDQAEVVKRMRGFKEVDTKGCRYTLLRKRTTKEVAVKIRSKYGIRIYVFSDEQDGLEFYNNFSAS